MAAPPAVITADSEWYSEYMKQTDNTEIQQLELQLQTASAKQSIGQKPPENGETCSKDSRNTCSKDSKNTVISPVKKHHITEVYNHNHV